MLKKLAILTRPDSSVLTEVPEVKDELEPPEGLLGTCKVLEDRLCLSTVPLLPNKV